MGCLGQTGCLFLMQIFQINADDCGDFREDLRNLRDTSSPQITQIPSLIPNSFMYIVHCKLHIKLIYQLSVNYPLSIINSQLFQNRHLPDSRVVPRVDFVDIHTAAQFRCIKINCVSTGLHLFVDNIRDFVSLNIKN